MNSNSAHNLPHPDLGQAAPAMYLPVAGIHPEAGSNSGPPGDPGLPFDLPTIARSLLGRWRWGLIWGVVSVSLGILAGLMMGTRTYTAETVLLHRHQPSVWTGLESAPMDSLSLNTKLHLVKVKSNLEETRRRLKLAATISQLGSAVDATSQRNADLMIIRAEWGSAQVAADLANTVAAVFFQSQVRIRYREELAVVDRMWREEQATAQRLEAQINDLSRMTEDLRNRIDTEIESSPADEGLGQLNIRISQLRDAIHDDQQQRANSAMLNQREAQLERARELQAQGMITQSEFETVEAEFHRLRALAVDTDQVAKWREELEELQGVVLPSDDNTTASAPLLQAVMLKGLDAEFEIAEARERTSQLLDMRLELQKKLDDLEAASGQPHRTAMAPWMADSDFRVVTAASEPSMPTQSNRRLMAGGTFLFLLFVGFLVIGAREFLSPTIRSGPEMALRLKIPSLGVTPRRDTRPDESPSRGERTPDSLRLLAQRILELAPERGARILITSPNHGEGRTDLTAGTALALSEMGEKVLVADGDTSRPGESLPPPAHRWAQKVRSFLRMESSSSASAGPALAELLVRGGEGQKVDCQELPAGQSGRGKATSLSLEALLEDSPEDYRIILVDGPPVLPGAEAQRLAASVDSVILAVRSSSTRSQSAKKSLNRLAGSGTSLLGAVLTDVDPVFVDLE